MNKIVDCNVNYLDSPENKKRIIVLYKIASGKKLNKKEKKIAGIISAELAEYLVWHPEP